MNKQELVDAIANNVELSKVDAQKALETVLSSVVSGVKKEPVQLVGFGTFKQVKRKARMGINPSTGAAIKIPAKTVMTFKVSKNPKY